MKAYLKQVRISPKKVNIVAALVRRKPVTEALTMLKFTPKRSAPVIAKLIASAAANAENNFKQNRDNLVIESIVVNAGPTLKRGIPVSRGRYHRIRKRTARIAIELAPATPKTEKKAEKPAAKKEAKKAEPKKAAAEKKPAAKKETSEKTDSKK